MNNGGHRLHPCGTPAVPRDQKMSMLPSERFESEAQQLAKVQSARPTHLLCLRRASLHSLLVKKRMTATMYYYRPAELSSFSVFLHYRVRHTGLQVSLWATFLLNAVITMHAA